MKKFIIILIYSIAYQIVHTQYLCKLFGYMGYSTHQLSLTEISWTALLIFLPLSVYPKDTLKEIVYTIFYFFLYIPILITFLNQYDNINDIIYNTFYISLGFLIIFYLSNKISNRSYKRRKPSKKKSLSIVLLIFIIVVIDAVLIVTFRNTFSFVGFANVYKQRKEASSNFNGIITYFLLWDTYFFGPLLLINGLVKRKRVYSLLGCISIIIVYGMSASKIAIFIPIGIIGIYYIVKKQKSIFNILGLGFSSIIVTFYIFSQSLYVLSAVVLMRTFGICGLLTYQYNEFFKTSPLTYYTHIGIVNLFSNNYYPYSQELGYVIASYFMDGSTANSNANFWATDGIAALGLYGVAVISIVMAVFLILVKSVENNHNRNILALMMVPFSFIVLNVGLFTSLISGGFIFLILYYLFFK